MNVVLILSTLLMTCVSWARPEIQIPFKVEISQKPKLTLGDIAEVKSSDEAFVRLLDQVVLRADARGLLLSQKLASKEIIMKLREAMEAGELRGFNPLFKVPSEVEVYFAKDVVSKEEVTRRITNILQSRCAACEYQVKVQNLPQIQAHEWSLDTTSLTAKGSFLIPISNAKGDRIAFISGQSKTMQMTPVTTRMVLQGERLQPGDVRMALMDVTYSKDTALSAEVLIGQMAARNLAAGIAIWSNDIRREPAAKKGQVVKATLGRDEIEITTNLVAEENGFIGDSIRLKNPENQKLLSGTIVEKGVVQLQ